MAKQKKQQEKVTNEPVTPEPQKPDETPRKPDKTPQQALRDDWPAKHTQLAPYITLEGKVRTGLKPSDQAKANEILKSYGF